MCGIAGVVNLRGAPADPALVKRMCDAIAHRGPDGEGAHVDGQVGLGHRRLAIIDLSEAAAQPMLLDGGDLVLTYNGEVYNFQELRAELEALGHAFRSRSDTEVVLRAYQAWGERCVHRFNGMFAFAVWDRRRQRLFLARDRYGVKPLYYHHGEQHFLFGSEVKALLEHPAVERRLCYPALSEYFTFQNVLSDRTLFEGVRLLPPGTTLTLDLAGPKPRARQARYWDYAFGQDGGVAAMGPAADEVRARFEAAVQRQLVADVPVGSYLSGGMDSGSVAAVAARGIPRLHTFSCGFDLSSASGLELNFDERASAEEMANRLKTEHYEVVLHAGDMEHVLPDLVRHLEDLRVGQCYPNYYTARLASKFVKVVLSGTGGDELFAGYPWRYYRGAHAADPEAYLRAYYQYWQRLVPDAERAAFFNDRAWERVRGHPPFDAFRAVFEEQKLALATSEDRVNASLYFELRTFLHGLLLVEDKVSMAHSLETRVPLLDNDLVDLALALPPRLKLRDLAHAPAVDENEPSKRIRYQAQAHSDGKVVFREAMAGVVPPTVASRAKQGFSAPDASWFRGDSIRFVNEVLGDPGARIYGVLRREYVSRILAEHTAGQVNHRLLIWSLLCFETWLKTFDVQV